LKPAKKHHAGIIRDIKRILRRQKGTTTEREYLFAHMNHVKGRLGWR